MSDNKHGKHQVILCSNCNKVIAQCRCISHEVETTYQLCDECTQGLIDTNIKRFKATPLEVKIESQPRLVEAIGYDKEKAEIAEILNVDVNNIHALDIVNQLIPSTFTVKGKAKAIMKCPIKSNVVEIVDGEKVVSLLVSKELAETLDGAELEVTVKRVNND